MCQKSVSAPFALSGSKCPEFIQAAENQGSPWSPWKPACCLGCKRSGVQIPAARPKSSKTCRQHSPRTAPCVDRVPLLPAGRQGPQREDGDPAPDSFRAWQEDQACRAPDARAVLRGPGHDQRELLVAGLPAVRLRGLPTAAVEALEAARGGFSDDRALLYHPERRGPVVKDPRPGQPWPG